MPINFNLAASPNTANNPGQDAFVQAILFNQQSTSHISKTFDINQEPYYIQGFDLDPTDVIKVQMVSGDGSGTYFSDLVLFGQTVQLDNTRSKIRLDLPGRYRLFFTGVDYTAIRVNGFPASMTHESTSEFADAMQSIIQSLIVGTGTVTATAPITISGGGTIISPYVIGATLATNLQEEVGSPTINLISAGVLKHIVNATTFTGTGGNAALGVGASNNGKLSVAIGSDAVTFGQGSISIGTTAGVGGSAGDDNIFIGAAAGTNTLTSNNVCIGTSTGIGLVGGNSITIGQVALAGAGASVTINRASCVAVGDRAGVAQTAVTSINHSVFVGASAGDILAGAATGSVCVGYQTAVNSTINSFNTLIGYRAGIATLGSSNVAIGSNAFQITSGAPSACVAVGNQTGNGATINSDCVLVGNGAASDIGSGNTVTLSAGTIAIGNAAFGGQTGNCTPTNYSMAIGNNAGDGETHSNVIIIGSHNTALNATADNQIILGNSTQTQLVTAGSVIAGGVIGPSDLRLKTDILEFTDGMRFIDAIHPIQFKWNKTKLDAAKLPYLRSDLEKVHYGVSAQEINILLPNIVEKVDGIDGEKYMFIHNDRLVPILISAVKELSMRVKQLEVVQ